MKKIAETEAFLVISFLYSKWVFHFKLSVADHFALLILPNSNKNKFIVRFFGDCNVGIILSQRAKVYNRITLLFKNLRAFFKILEGLRDRLRSIMLSRWLEVVGIELRVLTCLFVDLSSLEVLGIASAANFSKAHAVNFILIFTAPYHDSGCAFFFLWINFSRPLFYEGLNTYIARQLKLLNFANF